MISNSGPRRDHIGTPSTWIWNLLLNIKKDSLVAKFSKLQKSFSDISLIKVSEVWKSCFMQISIMSSNGMLVIKASTSKLAIQRPLSWVKVSWTKVVKRTGLKNFANFYVGVPIAERMGLSGGDPFLRGLCTWADP